MPADSSPSTSSRFSRSYLAQVFRSWRRIPVLKTLCAWSRPSHLKAELFSSDIAPPKKLHQPLRTAASEERENLRRRGGRLLFRGNLERFDLLFDVVNKAGRGGAVHDAMVESER